MKPVRLNCGYVPLVDAAPLVIAQELNFAAEEGISLNLLRQPSWSALRDLLALGHLDVAHMLSPMPIAMSLGLGGLTARVDALMVLSVNGNVLGVSNALAARMRAGGWSGGFLSPESTGRHLIDAAGGRLRIGVPFPFSMHVELLHYWLGSFGMTPQTGLEVHTVPPSLMADAIGAGDVDAFCVGEPWGSIVVEQNLGALILPGAAIWNCAPEKVLGARHDWVEAHPRLTGALMRAVWRATAWLSQPDNHALASEILSRSEHLDLPDAILDRALGGRLIARAGELPVSVPDFLNFHEGAANFPWRSQAAWIANGIAARLGLDPAETLRVARDTFRCDLYRAHLSPAGIDMPGASDKREGASPDPTPVASARGEMILGRNQFFDGRIFDPAP